MRHSVLCAVGIGLSCDCGFEVEQQAKARRAEQQAKARRAEQKADEKKAEMDFKYLGDIAEQLRSGDAEAGHGDLDNFMLEQIEKTAKTRKEKRIAKELRHINTHSSVFTRWHG